MARTGRRIREYEVGPPPPKVQPGPKEPEREPVKEPRREPAREPTKEPVKSPA